MLVDEQFRRCVTFLYGEKKATAGKAAEKVPVGSAFFVMVDLFEGTDAAGSIYATYVVTARHVIDVPHSLWLRIRRADGSFEDVPAPREAWAQHPNTDVAVGPCSLPDGHDVKCIQAMYFGTEELVAEKQVGEGDDVFFSGLFVGHYGKGVPQPIVRFGNIALMPHEPVRVEISKNPKTWADIEAYLVEARSWGGQSGSPAFVSFPPYREMGGGLVVGNEPPFALLGLVQGLWKDSKAAMAADPSGEGVIEVNMGISVVVPAYKIVEVLMSEPFAKGRAEMAAAAEKSRGSTTLPTAASSDSPGEHERFEDLTKRLVGVPKKELDEKLKEDKG